MFHETFIYRLAARLVNILFDLANRDKNVFQEQVSIEKVDSGALRQRSASRNFNGRGVGRFGEEGTPSQVRRFGAN